MSTKKRGQISIILAALVFFLLIGILIFTVNRIGVDVTNVELQQVTPVKSFVDTCIATVAEDGIRRLGLTGGYIYYPRHIETNPRSYLDIGPLAEARIPYWWYDTYESVPTEDFIIAQLERYIREELDACLSDFDIFGAQYDIEPLGELVPEVILNNNDVTILITYPMNLLNRQNQTSVRVSEFRETIPIQLKKAYETAKDVMEAENRDLFVEKKTIDLLVLDEDIPTTDVEATCEEKTWVVSEVREKMKRLLEVNLPYISVETSRFSENLYTPNPYGNDTFKESYYDAHFRWDINQEKRYDDFSIAFTYNPNWQMQFNVRPSSNGIMESNTQQGTDVLGFVCLQIWHFTYDVAYPVMVSVIDNSRSFDPFIFNFAFKVNVDHTQPDKESTVSTILPTADIDSTTEFCNDLAYEQTIYTESNTGDSVTDVDLTYTCGIYTCDIGKSDWLSFGAAAGLTVPFPYCVNGILRGSKEGYQDAEVFIQANRDDAHVLELTEINDITNIELVKNDMNNPALEYNPLGVEQASISITSADESFQIFTTYPATEGLPLELPIANEAYDVEIFVTNGETIVGAYRDTWHVSADAARDANTIRFHVVQFEGDEDERFALMNNIESLSNNIPEPELFTQ